MIPGILHTISFSGHILSLERLRNLSKVTQLVGAGAGMQPDMTFSKANVPSTIPCCLPESQLWELVLDFICDEEE